MPNYEAIRPEADAIKPKVEVIAYYSESDRAQRRGGQSLGFASSYEGLSVRYSLSLGALYGYRDHDGNEISYEEVRSIFQRPERLSPADNGEES